MNQASYRALLAVIAAAATLSLLTGCSAASSPAAIRTVTAAAPSAAATPSAAPSRTQSAAAPTSGTGSSSPTSASSISSTTKIDPDAPAGQCRDSALKVTVQDNPEAAGAGQRGAFIVFRNTGSSSCHLEGTPGLSLVGGGNGTQIGKPAKRSTSGAKLVTVKPGTTALAQVQYTYVDKNGGNYNDGNGHDGNGHDVACKAKAADGYRVYPPHSYRASFTTTKTYACSTAVHWISVNPVRPATDFKYFTPRT